MPHDPARKSWQKLADTSPLLDTEAIERLFPTERDKRGLEKLGEKLERAIQENHSAARIWKSLGDVKEVALKLVGQALGARFPWL